MWILMAFCSAFFAGITGVLAKIGVKNVNSNLATALRTVIVLIFSCLLVFISGAYKEINQITGKSLLFLTLSGLSTGGSWLCYFKALQLGNVNKVTPVDKSSTILTMLLAIIFFKEEVTAFKIIGMLAIAAGTGLMLTKSEEQDEQPKSKGWLIYAFLSALLASLTSILGKMGVTGINSDLGTAIRTVVVLIMAWLVVLFTGGQKGISRIEGKSWLFLCLSGITTGLSWLCYYRALQEGDAGIIAPIDKLSILITIAFSRIFLKEKLTVKAGIGLAILTVGTLILIPI